MKPIQLLNLGGLMNVINEIIDKFDETWVEHKQWIEDCLLEANNRHTNNDVAVPITPMGRPRTRNFMKKRAMQMEMIARLDISRKSKNSTPKKVSINATPQYLNKSKSLKKILITKAIKNSAKKAKEIKKKQREDPVRKILFKSPVAKQRKLGALVETAQETKKIATSGKLAATKKNAEESKPLVRKTHPKQKIIIDKLKDNLEFLLNNILKSPDANVRNAKQVTRSSRVKQVVIPSKSTNEKQVVIPSKSTNEKQVVIPSKSTNEKQVVAPFKSPVKVVKSKIDTGLEQIKNAAKKKDKIVEKATMVIGKQIIPEINKDEFGDSEIPEMCNKSLQVSFPTLTVSPVILNKSLSPYVRLVDIGASLSNAMNNNHPVAKLTPKHQPGVLKSKSRADSTEEYYSAHEVNGLEDKKKKVPMIYSSTPINKHHMNPLISLEKLNLTRITMGGSPPGRTLDQSDAYYEMPVLQRQANPPATQVPIVILDSHITIDDDDEENHVVNVAEKPVENRNGKAAAVTENQPVATSSNPNPVVRPEIKQVAPQKISSNAKGENVVLSSKSPIVVTVNGNKNNCNAGQNLNHVAEEEEVSSYDMTPVRKAKKFLPSTTNDYNINDMDSDDSTDNEYEPRKVVPAWARPENLRRVLHKQACIPLEEIYGIFNTGTHENLDLIQIFTQSKRPRKLNKRTSSVCWEHPPLKRQNL